jgi:hypothetical protein
VYLTGKELGTKAVTPHDIVVIYYSLKGVPPDIESPIN